MNLFWWLSPKKKRAIVKGETLDSVRREWSEIKILLAQGSPSQLKQALIAADKTVDTVLKDIIEGDTMGERLRNARDKFDDRDTYQGIWDAHKMRNALVHESGFELTHFSLKKGVEKLKEGLKALGIAV
ncbi:hypothetical protein JXA34_01400 [Patescibacteria group bacterium]|nr:hypothetical protein [Patescibacteria group bacterium]